MRFLASTAAVLPTGAFLTALLVGFVTATAAVAVVAPSAATATAAACLLHTDHDARAMPSLPGWG
ncbi:MAG: hypothetical protein QOF83_1308 [Solirubrobacteraceae bacterium]|jgi:hypothetical protein|nr:hypothetical protein [Solirubrobacteraceae bacterium]